MTMPERITHAWMLTLDDDALLKAESSLRTTFAKAEQAHRKVVGKRYDLMRGPAELLGAWDRWSRVCTEVRARKLDPKRKSPK